MVRSAKRLQQASIVIGTRDEAERAAAVETLGRRGFQLVFAESDREVVSRANETAPSLILLTFPGMQDDDFALCRALARRRDGESRAVLVGAAPEPRVIDRAYSAGATDFLPLPLHWPLLGHRVRQLLRASYAIAELGRARSSLETLQRVAGLGTFTWQRASGAMRWSEKIYEILGLSAGSADTGFEAFCLCMHPEDRAFSVQVIERALRGGRSFDLPVRIVQPSGAVRHVQLRGEALAGSRVTGTMQDVTEERRAQEKIHYLAHYDSLTGLANRRRFMEQIERAKQRAEQADHRMALLYMDLDQFKRVNDTLGHGAGDHLLRGVAELLFDQVRSTDVVGRTAADPESEISRLGGDEFAILLTEIGDREDAEIVAKRILAAIPTPIPLESQEISATASIGIAVYPDDGEDVETLVKHADRAMYSAKERGRNQYAFFSESMSHGSMRRLHMESQLRSAVESEALYVLYQPRLRLDSNSIEGAEALLRWNDPELGAIMPKEFIPLAEETGLILPLGRWVLGQACAQVRRWRASGKPPVRMSVNVSTRQIAGGDLPAMVAESLRAAELHPGDLELEITESAMLQEDGQTTASLRAIRDMGVRIALDDFGTGYSSLSYLERFPLDTLKLDRSLVRDVATSHSAQGIVQAVINMAHALGLEVVAEGVDREDQRELLRDLGCDELQGFLISEAIEAKRFAELLDESDDQDLPGLALREG